MDIVLVGLNHETACVKLREKLGFPEHCVRNALKALVAGPGQGIAEAVLISTCNRVEIYAVVENGDTGIARIQEFLSKFHSVALSEFESHLLTKSNIDAIHHLFSVASSIKSMVLGENQIQGQIKQAFELAKDAGSAGPILTTLFQNALTVGKRVRNETAINQHSLSISHAAVSMLRQKYTDLTGKRILVVGNGKMGVLAIRALQKIGGTDVTIVNRTMENVIEIAEELNLEVRGLDLLASCLAEADIVISSTGAPHPIITKEMVAEATSARDGRRLLLIDIAVPRDIEESVAEVDNAELHNIDQLQGAINANRDKRANELRKVEEIVAAELKKFMAWLHTLQVKPVIKGLRSRAEQIRDLEMQRALRRFGDDLSESDTKIVQELTTRIINKMLHEPIIKLREEAAQGNGVGYTAAINDLFGLEEQPAAGQLLAEAK